jgi:hypothetical protein
MQKRRNTMPSRFPYGFSFIKPGEKSGAYTFTAGDQTPDVSLGTVFVAASSAITITRFDGGELGKLLILISNSGSVTTIQNSAGAINLFASVSTVSNGALIYSSTGNYVMANKEAMMFMHNGSDWSQVSASLRIP